MIESKEPAFLRIRFYTTLPAVLLLLGVLVYGTGGLIHARLLQLGEHVWPGYHALRSDPVTPECEADALRQRRADALAAHEAKQAGGAAAPNAAPSEDDLLDDLLDDDEPTDDGEPGAGQGSDGVDLDALLEDEPSPKPPKPPSPPPEPAPAPSDEVDLDALLEDDAPARAPPGAAPAPEGDVDLDALLEDAGDGGSGDSANGDADDSSDGGDVDLDALLGDGPDEAEPTPAGLPPAIQAFDNAIAACEAKHAAYSSAVTSITPNVRRFRVVEGAVQRVVEFGVDSLSHLLALLILICAVATTAFKHHIALRPPRARIDHIASEVSQLIAFALLAWSAWQFKTVDVDAFGKPQNATLHLIWVIGFAVLALVNIYNLITLPKGGPESRGILRALLSVPLFATMALIAGGYFLLAEDHGAGLAIYVAKLTEHALLYLNVGLYVWVGMLLKRTALANLCFDVLRPWKMPPEILAFVAVVGAALPTAYSGASGIFVIAAGAVIYRELRKAGARRQLALAATAMSGSMGVVLSPCLLVVIVASLNNEVTTDQLYGWGFKVFVLSAVLFLAASLLNRQGKLSFAGPKEALPGSLAALAKLVPYLLLFAVLLVLYRVTVDAGLDEHSAPVILPVLMIGVLLYDRFTQRQVTTRTGRVVRFGFRRALGAATSETTGHIGALLLLMGMSICLGGIIERAELMELVPATFGSPWATMGVLVVVLVVVGMCMDPYGAVVLVSATVAAVAYRNGIDPVHFWMVVLVAFELGYLTPPVALNHLLTRQVVGDTKVERAENEGQGFWSRHERLLLPITVMGIALLVTAFAPLAFDGYGQAAETPPAAEAPAEP